MGTSTFEPNAGAGKNPKTDPEGDYRDDRVMLAKLAPFSGDPKEGRAFLNAFLLRASRCSGEQKQYWFRQLAGPSCFSWFESGRWDSWDEMERAFLASFTVRYKKGEALKQAASPPQGSQETVVQYRARFETYLPYVDVERDLDDVIDAFLGGLKSTLVGGAGLLRGTATTWPSFVNRIAQLEWDLGGAHQAQGGQKAGGASGAHVAMQGEGSKKRSAGASSGRMSDFKKACPHRESKGCWICGQEGHRVCYLSKPSCI